MDTQFLEKRAKKVFKESPLVHCVTNEITCESMANALLYVNSKPIMADDPREFQELFSQTDALLLNLGHLSPDREKQLMAASEYANQFNTPTVIDVVGVSVSSLRKKLAFELLKNKPQVVKGNTSEMKKFCGLSSHGRGVDGHVLDQGKESLQELAEALQELVKTYPDTSFLATGAVDVIVTGDKTYLLSNGVPELDKRTGTGDMVGAIIAALLGQGETVESSLVMAVSYFNICGELAKELGGSPIGMEDFNYHLMNELSLLHEQENWWQSIKGEKTND
ncbi:hydroxyethylthiazole kinase [Vagococcus sp. DIV0080]|uniref:Hydroxyethylthiazole kinase n=1 Tax=Candidatus Vagococcus giribetii TaxID=2230876 RepID=A0ABS3HVM3_9ENTE|nr:hydroxyethylthiazole kinase [Vagococcus sp. DIV0080]MBO0477808.1 hydroxyethylthiazole kinase [Vagococcus sp. DIV0080]